MIKKFFIFFKIFLIINFSAVLFLSYSHSQEKINNVYIVKVVPGSPGEKAGLKAGDVIVEINGQKITDYSQVLQITKKSIQSGNYKFLFYILRNSQKFYITVNLSRDEPFIGIMVSNLSEGASTSITASRGKISEELLKRRIDKGKPEETEKVKPIYSRNLIIEEINRKIEFNIPSKITEKIEKINVLDCVFINPETKEIVFMGHYDDKYKTGSLPYNQILEEALKYSYPSFSFEIIPETIDSFKKIESIFDSEMFKIKNDINYGKKWIENIMRTILFSKEATPEKIVFEKRIRKPYSILPEELYAYLTWEPESPKWTFKESDFEQTKKYYLIRSFMNKLFNSVGIDGKYGEGVVVFWYFNKYSNIYGVEKSGYKFREIYEVMGLEKEFEKIRQDFNSGKIDNYTASRELIFLYYKNLLSGMGVSKDKIENLIKRAPLRGNFDKEISEFANTKIEEIQRNALSKIIFNNLVLSYDFLKSIFNLPEIKVGVKYFGISSDTYLGQIFYNADYTLKYVETLNPNTANLDNFLSFNHYLVEKVSETKKFKEFKDMKKGLDRSWIYPGKVEIKELPDKSGVYFGNSEVKIGVESLINAPEWYNKILNSYANELNKNYEKIASIYPSLYVMKEIQKVIALARWLKQNNINVKIPEYDRVNLKIAENTGFIGASFVYPEEGENFFFFLIIHGGISFDKTEGENWIKKQTVAKDALECLIASNVFAEKAVESALNGDLEGARELAEKSAEAMVGLIDKSYLKNIPVPSVDKEKIKVPLSNFALVNREFLNTFEKNIAALSKANEEIKNIEKLKEVDVEKYKKEYEYAKIQEEKIKESLKKLKEYINNYYQQPVNISTVRATIKLLQSDEYLKSRSASTKPTSETTNKKQIKEEEILPDKEQLKIKLLDLKNKLEIAKRNMDTLTKSILENTKEFEKWTNQTEDAIKRSETRLKDILKDLITEKSFELIKDYFKKFPDRVKEIERFEQLLSTKEYADWASIKEHTWDDIAEGLVKAIEAMPLVSEKVKKFTKNFKYFIDTSYDISIEFIQWQKLKQFEKDLELYSKAIEMNKVYIKNLLKEIDGLEKKVNE